MPIRVCFFGDSFVNGTGDDACLGWVGRACAASRRRGHDVTCYNLGIRRDTSAEILRRWKHEALARLPPEHDGGLVFSFGANDCCLDDSGDRVRVPHDAAVGNARNILAAARSWLPTLMVGPLPVGDPDADARVAALSAAFATLCASLEVPYLEVFRLAANSDAWAREVPAGDGAHPHALGYSVVSRAFEEWRAWQAWHEPAPA
jgi:lysophospholipase L1-like esterase